MESYLHVGRSLCGHDGVIHGGLLATILDEAMGRVVRGPHLHFPHTFLPNNKYIPLGRCYPQAVMNLDARIGVTANLTINYRAPTRADQFIVIKTRLVSAKGRKVEVSARIEDLDGRLLADGR
jgi:acyl-coenzyme A thioesterase PaaI-like protein